MDISTAVGIVPLEKLTIKDIVTFESTARIIATEWYMDMPVNSEDIVVTEPVLVRRDVWVSALCGQDMSSSAEM